MNKQTVFAVVWLVIVSSVTFYFGYQGGYHVGSKEADAAFSRGLEEGYATATSTRFYMADADRHRALVLKYGSIKTTPWDEFLIREKMFLCAYGSPGNKLSADEIQEIMLKYGDEDVVAFAEMADEFRKENITIESKE